MESAAVPLSAGGDITVRRLFLSSTDWPW
uniref:Uncharacterized protein n=1 Tax=Arundo donax TaxID=35708 RepID=A0A0A9BLX7_ARUDO